MKEMKPCHRLNVTNKMLNSFQDSPRPADDPTSGLSIGKEITLDPLYLPKSAWMSRTRIKTSWTKTLAKSPSPCFRWLGPPS